MLLKKEEKKDESKKTKTETSDKKN